MTIAEFKRRIERKYRGRFVKTRIRWLGPPRGLVFRILYKRWFREPVWICPLEALDPKLALNSKKTGAAGGSFLAVARKFGLSNKDAYEIINAADNFRGADPELRAWMEEMAA